MNCKTYVVEWEEVVQKYEFIYAKDDKEAELVAHVKINKPDNEEYSITDIREVETGKEILEE